MKTIKSPREHTLTAHFVHSIHVDAIVPMQNEIERISNSSMWTRARKKEIKNKTKRKKC